MRWQSTIFINQMCYPWSTCVCANVQVHVRVCVPGRCPTVWLCSAAAVPSSKDCSSSGRQTAGTPPRTAACGGAPTLSKQCSWLATNKQGKTHQKTKDKIKFQLFFFSYFGQWRKLAVAITGQIFLLTSHSRLKPNHSAHTKKMRNVGAFLDRKKKKSLRRMFVCSWETTFISRCLPKHFHCWICVQSMAVFVHCVDYLGNSECGSAVADNEWMRLLVQTPFLCGGCMLFYCTCIRYH